MASIFLSYAREDAAKAKTLANALERAGHEVWWDRQIFGGSEFSDEIEAALKDADVVLVLWSEAAVKSAWVRDEAAEGRDSGRLVPVLLEDCTPPLGFRQVQSIPLAGWQGRGKPPHLQKILHAVAVRTGKKPTVPAGDAQRLLLHRPLMLALGVLGALLVAVGGWWLLEGRGEASETPVLAVLPFSDLSPKGDKAYFAEGVAEAILTVLAKEPGIQVVGRSTAQQLHEAGNDAAKMRKALGVTHILEGTARSVGDQLRMSVRLIDAKDGQQLWAEEYRRRLDNVFAVQDEIGRAVAQRLKGSFASSTGASRPLTSVDAYTLYLAARAKMRDRRMSSLQDALKLARQVIAADPNYAPGHALYAELIWHMSSENYGTIPIERVREVAGPHARRAIQIAPASPEGHAALGVISTGEAAIESLTKAIRFDPARAELRLWLARAHEKLGNNALGLEQLRLGSEMDPLFAPIIWNYVWWLGSSGRFDDVERVIDQFERRGGSRAVAARMRGEALGWFRGNISEGVRFARLALAIDPETPLARANLAGAYSQLGLADAATDYAAHLPLYSRLQSSGQTSRLLSQIRSDGADVWKRPDPAVAIRALAIRREWSEIERLFAFHPDHQHICSGSGFWHVQLLIDVATALHTRGRSAEAAQLIGCVRRVLSAHSRSPVRSGLMPGPFLDLFSAELHALDGEPERAFPLLRRAVSQGIRTDYGRGLAEYPAFDGFSSLTAYADIDARLKLLIAQERAEVLRMRLPPSV